MTPSEAEVSNPFVLLMNPEAVFKAIESSERLSRLHSRICRPLDRPQGVPPGAAAVSDPAAVDVSVGFDDDGFDQF